MTLHPNAALRVLRREMVRLNDGRLELIEAMTDPRIPAGVAVQQVQQCDREIDELVWAHRTLEACIDAQKAEAA
jgi:hypothetical protein